MGVKRNTLQFGKLYDNNYTLSKLQFTKQISN